MRDHRQVVNGVSRRLRAGAHRTLNSRQLARPDLPGQMPVDRHSCHHHQPTSGVMTTCGLERVPMVLGGGDAVQDAIGRGLRSPEHGHHLTRRQVGTRGCGHQQDSVSQWQPARPARLPITAAAPHQRHQLPELGFGRLGERLAHSLSIATNSAARPAPSPLISCVPTGAGRAGLPSGRGSPRGARPQTSASGQALNPGSLLWPSSSSSWRGSGRRVPRRSRP